MTVARNPSIAPFPTDPVVTGVVLAYRNNKLIADSVLPRVTVGRKEFKHLVFGKGDAFTLPETRVGRRSKPNSTEYGATEAVGACAWQALDAEIPNDDISHAPPGHSPINQHAMLNAELIALRREKRVADKVFAPATYPVGSKATLAGADRWSDITSDPLGQIDDAKDSRIMAPNILVLGKASWRFLSRHPQILKSVNRNDGDTGRARLRDVAELLELDQILVGEGWVNIAAKGQAVNMVRVWGVHAALLHINPNANTEGGITFGYTAQYGGKLGGQWPDKDIGAEGGVRVRTGECVGETICAPDCGYLLENAGDNS